MRDELKITIYQENEPMFRVCDEVKQYDKEKYHKVFERTDDPAGYFNQTDYDILEGLFEEFNCGDYPEDYKGHSMSVGDVVEINGVAYICASFGFHRIEWK